MKETYVVCLSCSSSKLSGGPIWQEVTLVIIQLTKREIHGYEIGEVIDTLSTNPSISFAVNKGKSHRIRSFKSVNFLSREQVGNGGFWREDPPLREAFGIGFIDVVIDVVLLFNGHSHCVPCLLSSWNVDVYVFIHCSLACST